MNPTVVAVLTGVFLLLGLALARAARGERTTRWIVLLILVLPLMLLLLPWAVSARGRLEQTELALVLALGLGLIGWAVVRLRRRNRSPRNRAESPLPASGRQDGSEPQT